MNITEFLEARIAEDEALAQAAMDWVANGPEPHYSWFGSHGEVTGKRFGAALPHIATMSPARVLAECAAKRAITRAHRPAWQLEGGYRTSQTCEECGRFWHGWVLETPTPEFGCPTVRALAAVYASHPDYRQEWKQD